MPGDDAAGMIAPPRFTDPTVRFRWPVALAFAALCVAASYPGRLNPDSLYSVITAGTGRVGNWHSPTLGWLWGLAAPWLGQPASGLLFQAALFGLFAGFLPDVPATARGRITLALEVVLRLALVGAFGFLGKDVVVFGTLALAVQLARHDLSHPWPAWRIMALVALVTLFLVVKSPNFLTLVLALALIAPFFLRSVAAWAGVVALAALAGALAVPLTRAVDRHVFAATDEHPDKQLVIFDLAGTSVRTGTDLFTAVPGWPADLPPVARCYLPYMWDSFAPWGPCRAYSAAYDALDRRLTRAWLGAIAAHPLAYAGHRLTFAGHLLGSRDHVSWGLGGSAVNDVAAPGTRAELREMTARLAADRPIQLWRGSFRTAPLRWLEAAAFRFPGMQAVGVVGALAVLLFGWIGRHDRVRLGALLPAALAAGNFGMLLAFGVADAGRYLLPTLGLTYLSALALLAPPRDTGLG